LGWAERTNAYLDGAGKLFVAAATRALEVASIGAADVDTVVTISSTGIATPSLEARAAAVMGFRPDIVRVPGVWSRLRWRCLRISHRGSFSASAAR